MKGYLVPSIRDGSGRGDWCWWSDEDLDRIRLLSQASDLMGGGILAIARHLDACKANDSAVTVSA